MRWRDALDQPARTARLMVGIPDYEAYAAHRSAEHPGEPMMTRAEFLRNRTEQRFGAGGGISRCC